MFSMSTSRITFSATALLLALTCWPSSSHAASRLTYLDHAVNATDVLNQKWYNTSDGQWQDMWWNSANALTSLADLTAVDKAQFASTSDFYFRNTLVAAQASNGGNFLNKYYGMS
jgi:hypothetical protein